MRIPMKLDDKNKQVKKPKALFSLSPTAIFCALVLSAPSFANAGVMDKMMEGVYTNTTDASKFQSQKMGHYQGGSFYARFPTKSINIAMFDPPRIQAGCGGIDMFGGSFSFISGDEIVQILRSIGQNALGLLFQMGIQAISQPLSTLLSHFSDKLQQMNQALRNSCAAANKLVSLVTDGPAQDNMFDKDKIKSTFRSVTKDAFDAFKKGQEQGWEGSLWQKLSSWKKPEDLNAGGSDEDADMSEVRKNPITGNATWKALTNSKAHKRFSDQMNNAMDERQIKELIINIGGTTIFTANKSEDNSKPVCDNNSASNCDAPPIVDHSSQYFHAKQLIQVSDKDQIYTCKDVTGVNHNGTQNEVDMACTTMQATALKDTFKGAAYYVNKALFGSGSLDLIKPEEIDNAIQTSKGLIGKGLSGSVAIPSDDELAILNNSSVPFVAHLFYLQVDPSAQRNAAILVYDTLVRKYANLLGENLLRVADGAYLGGETKVYAKKPEQYDANIRNFQKELEDIKVTVEEELELNTKLFTIREQVQRAANTRAVSNRISKNSGS